MNSLPHWPHIDGLRAIAVVAVVLFHAQIFGDWGGFAGVDIFFVISGYLITRILLTNPNHMSHLATFYERRIRRIFPALCVVLLCSTLLASYLMLPYEYDSFAQSMLASALFIPNWHFMQQTGYFDAGTLSKPLLHLWSLGVEEQFYLIWPILLFGIRRLKNRLSLVAITALLICSLLVNLYLAYRQPNIAFYSPISRFWELISGCLLAYLHANNPVDHNIGLTQDTKAWLGISLIAAGFILIDEHAIFPGWLAMLPVIGTFLIIDAGKHAWLNQRLLAHPLMVWIGLISYPLYLWHWPIFSFASLINGRPVSMEIAGLLIILSTLLAWLSYLYIEIPIRKNTFHLPIRYILTVLLAAMAGIGLLAYQITLAHGARHLLFTPDIATEKLLPLEQSLAQEKKNCLSRYPHKEICYSNFSGAAVADVVFVGDSHAGSIAAGFMTKHLEIPTIAFPEYGCPPFLGINRVDRHHRKTWDCHKHNLQTIKNFDDKKRQVFILAARFNMYASGHKLGPEAKLSGTGAEVHIQAENHNGFYKQANNTKLFASGLNNMISALENQGEAVILVFQAPELEFDPKACLRTNIRTCKIDRSHVEAQQAMYRRIVQGVLTEHPNVRTVDPLHMLCDKQDCYGKIDNQLLYIDSHHLIKTGSDLLSEAIHKEISLF